MKSDFVERVDVGKPEPSMKFTINLRLNTANFWREMIPIELYCPGAYVNPLTRDGRGRTIAAFLIAQRSEPTCS
jgi:hypothetical protein